MTDQGNPSPSGAKLEEARKLMDQGRHQESLALAMEALLQELDHLRHSLRSLETLARRDLPDAAPAREEPPRPEPAWLWAAKPRVLH
jgi:hypothetical protein